MENLMQFATIRTAPDVTLLLLLILTIQSFLTSGMLWLLQFCFKHTPGFTGYYRALLTIYNNPGKPAVLRALCKPLGLCVYCMGPYVAAVVYALSTPNFNIINALFQIGATYFFTEFLGKIIYPPKPGKTENESLPAIPKKTNITEKVGSIGRPHIFRK